MPKKPDLDLNNMPEPEPQDEAKVLRPAFNEAEDETTSATQAQRQAHQHAPKPADQPEGETTEEEMAEANTSKPSTEPASTEQSSTEQTSVEQSSVDSPTSAKSESAEPELDQSESAKPEPANSESAKPEPAKPEPTNSASTKSSFLDWLTTGRRTKAPAIDSTTPQLHHPQREGNSGASYHVKKEVQPTLGQRPVTTGPSTAAAIKKIQPFNPKKATFRLYLFAFLIPIFVMFIAYSTVGFYPVGDKTALTIDMYHQYAPFLSELKRKLASGESLFYAWNTGLGTNFYALIAYYAASPLNLLLLLFPLKHLTEGIYLLTLLKTGLMGLTMAIFLNKGLSPQGLLTFHRSKAPDYRRPMTAPGPRYAKRDVATDLVVLAFSSAYALSAYTFSYAWCVMWLDGLILFPLAMLGLLYLLRDGKVTLYSISVGLAILINYYIAIFVCLFAIVYFVYQLFTDQKTRTRIGQGNPWLNFFRRIGRFVWASLLAGGLSAIMALPTFLSLLHTSASGDTWPQAHSFFFQLFDFPARFFIGSTPNIRSGLPNVYAGVLTILLIPVYLKSERISLREKAFSIGTLAFLFLGFNSNFLNFLWHGMHYPNQLPHRFAFVYVFFVITLAYRGLISEDFQGVSKTITKSALVAGFFLFLVQKLNVTEISELMIYVSIIFLALYALIFALSKAHQHRLRYTASLLLVVFVAELCMNGISMANQVNQNEYYTRRSDFIRDFDEVTELISDVKAREPEGAFYRMELEPQKTTNDPALYGYPGFTLFSSTSPEETAALMRSLGYHGNNINSYKYVDSTPFLDALWGLKYFVWKNGETNDPTRHRFLRGATVEDRTARLYENPDAMGLGILAPLGLRQWEPGEASAFANQNSLARNLTGIDGLYKPLPLEEVSVSNAYADGGGPAEGFEYRSSNTAQAGNYSLRYTAVENSRALFFIDTARMSTINYQVKRGEEVVREASRSINKPETFDPGPLEAGDTLEIKVDYKENEGNHWTIWLAEQQEDVYKRLMEALHERSVDWTFESATELTATVQGQAPQSLFLSIPYDPGWTLYVNGEAIDDEKEIPVGGGLLGYELPEGVLDLRLEFKPEGFNIGAAVSLGSLAIWIILLILEQRRKTSKLPGKTNSQGA